MATVAETTKSVAVAAAVVAVVVERRMVWRREKSRNRRRKTASLECRKLEWKTECRMLGWKTECRMLEWRKVCRMLGLRMECRRLGLRTECRTYLLLLLLWWGEEGNWKMWGVSLLKHTASFWVLQLRCSNFSFFPFFWVFECLGYLAWGLKFFFFFFFWESRAEAEKDWETVRSENFVFGRQKLCNFYATNLNLVLTLFFLLLILRRGIYWK